MTSIIVGAVDDVAVGQDEPVGREDEPRPAAGLRAHALLAAWGADVDADDGRRDAIDGMNDRARVGVEELVAGVEVGWRGVHGSCPSDARGWIGIQGSRFAGRGRSLHYHCPSCPVGR